MEACEGYCDACQYVTIVTHYDAPRCGNASKLCVVCANTPIGNSYIYSDNRSPEYQDFMKTIGWGINFVLEAVAAINVTENLLEKATKAMNDRKKKVNDSL